MKSIIAAILIVVSLGLRSQTLTIYRSDTTVDVTVEKLVESIKARDLVYFETVDHDAIAASQGVEIPPTRMILFEDPKLMIELISCAQTTALDLPMKILVWEENSDVYIGFFDPKVMKKRFMLQGCEDIISNISRLKIRIVNEVLKEL